MFKGLGFRVQGLRFGVWGLGVGVQSRAATVPLEFSDVVVSRNLGYQKKVF